VALLHETEKQLLFPRQQVSRRITVQKSWRAATARHSAVVPTDL